MVPGGAHRGAAPAAYSSVSLVKAISSSDVALVKLMIDEVQSSGTVQAAMSGVITRGTPAAREKSIAASEVVVPSSLT